METLVWMRVPGDIVFALGAVLLAGYALRLLRRPASRVETQPSARLKGRKGLAVQAGRVGGR
jgi:nitric oxide reductase subunit B